MSACVCMGLSVNTNVALKYTFCKFLKVGVSVCLFMYIVVVYRRICVCAYLSLASLSWIGG